MDQHSGLSTSTQHTSEASAEPPSPTLSTPASSSVVTRSPTPHQCSTPCRGILRRRQQFKGFRPRSQSPGKSVSFAEAVDEHLADDWDRKAVKVACPTYREILELKQMMLELLPDRRGLCGPEYSLAYDDSDTGCSQYFNFDDDADVDRSSRGPPNRQRLLKKVPLELCPILPAASTTKTPLNSRSGSPVSPLRTPSQGPSPPSSYQSSPATSPKLSPARTPLTLELNSTRPNNTKTLSSDPSSPPPTIHHPVPRPKPMMMLLPLLPPPSPTILESHKVPTPPLTPIAATEALKSGEKTASEQPSPNGNLRTTSHGTPLPIQPLSASPVLRTSSSQAELGSCYSTEPSQRQVHAPSLMGSYRGSLTPSPPPLPLLHALSSCSPPLNGGLPCSVTFKARANLGTAA